MTSALYRRRITSRVAGFDVTLVHIGATEYDKNLWSYTVITPTGAVFAGREYATPRHWKDSEIAGHLAAWHCLRPGDTDAGYFDDYTPEQMRWARSFECESAAAELSDLGF